MNEPATHPILANRWKLLAPIARGRGEVSYLAEEVRTRVRALVRLLDTDDAQLLHRIAGHTAARIPLQPPVLMRPLDAGSAETLAAGAVFVATEFVEAESLRDRFDRRVIPMSPREAITLVRSILEALRTVHEAGVVHCDLCPENCLMLAPHDPRALETPVRFYDLGRSRVVVPTPHAQHAFAPPLSRYAAPELQRGGPFDKRADVFSVGMMLFEMLTTLGPGAASGNMPITSPAASEELIEIYRRATAADPRARFADAAAMLAALNALRPLGQARLPSHSPFSTRGLEDSTEQAPLRSIEFSESDSDLLLFDDDLVMSLQHDAKTPVAVDPVRFDQPATSRQEHRTRPTQPVPLVDDTTPLPSILRDETPPVIDLTTVRTVSASIEGMILPALPKPPSKDDT